MAATTRPPTRGPKSPEKAAKYHDLLIRWQQILDDIEAASDDTPDEFFEGNGNNGAGAAIDEGCDGILDVLSRIGWEYARCAVPALRKNNCL